MLSVYSKKGNKKKVSQFKQEMKKFFNIEMGKLKFGNNNKGFVLDAKQNMINESMLSIKFLNQQCAEDLYILGQKKYPHFIDVLIDIKEQSSVNSRQLEILTKLNYFQDFAYNQKILDFIEKFNELYFVKQIKKEKCTDAILFSLIKKYSNKETEKLYKEINTRGILLELWNTIENKKIKLSTQAETEIEYLGYLKLQEEKLQENYYIVVDLKFYKNKLTPFLRLYNIKNGEIITARITDERLFSEKTLKQFNVIKILKEGYVYKNKKIDGQWKKSNEKDLVLQGYIVI